MRAYSPTSIINLPLIRQPLQPVIGHESERLVADDLPPPLRASAVSVIASAEQLGIPVMHETRLFIALELRRR